MDLHIDDTLLPVAFQHKIVVSNKEEYVLRCNLKTIADIDIWIRAFESLTNTQWRSRHSNPHPSSHLICMKRYVCHRSDYGKVKRCENKKGGSKNASCNAKVHVQIKALSKRNKKNPYMKAGLWALIRITKAHSHTINSSQALRFLQDKDGRQKMKFSEYFFDSMSPAEAKRYHEHILKLQNATSEEFDNGSKNPTNRTIHYWYTKWRSSNSAPRSTAALIEKIREKKTEFNETGAIIEFEENPFCVLIITPLMQRAHALPMAKKVVFLDTTNSSDDEKYAITFLLTSCAIGAVPLGILISTSQTTEAYTKGFNLFEKVFPNCFGNNGFPETILTDNSAAEIAAIENVWPDTKTFLCSYHILQTIWRWLCDSKNKIFPDDRLIMIRNFKSVLDASNLLEMHSTFNKCMEISTKYPHWKTYMDYYWNIKENWCVAYRDTSVRRHRFDIYVECSIRIFKEIALSCIKPYNVIALINFCVTTLETFYITKLNNFANFKSRDSHHFLKENLGKNVYAPEADIISINDGIFLVPSERDKNTSYTVDCYIGVCSCVDGRYGKFCKHQQAVFQNCNISFYNFPSMTSSDRYDMAQLAFDPKKEPNSNIHKVCLPEDDFINGIENVDCLESDDEMSELVTLSDVSNLNHGIVELDTYENSDPQPDEPKDKIKDLTSSISELLHKKISAIPKSDALLTALKKFENRIEQLGTEEEIVHFLHTCGGPTYFIISTNSNLK